MKMTYFINILDKNKIITGFTPDKWMINNNSTYEYSKCCLDYANYGKLDFIKKYIIGNVFIYEYSIKCLKCNCEQIGHLHISNKQLDYYDWKTFILHGNKNILHKNT